MNIVNDFFAASRADFGAPNGFSFDASLIIVSILNSRLTSEIGLPAL